MMLPLTGGRRESAVGNADGRVYLIVVKATDAYSSPSISIQGQR